METFGSKIPEYHPDTVSVKQPAKWLVKDFRKRSKSYFLSLFPFLGWIYKYNLTWFWSDLIAGLTVGIVVVPQGMSYAQVAGLPVQYGLYSSFIGVILYMFFATSKDVSIGPVAVMSLETYKAIHRVLSKLPHLTEADAPAIGGVLSLMCGGITFGLGFLRLGFLLEYISMPCVLGFMTGSAFTIAVGQVPSLMGLSKRVDTQDASYLVAIHTLENLGHTKVDAAFGLVSLFILFALKYSCDFMAQRDPRRRRIWFFLGTLRSALVIIFSTVIAWGVCHKHRHTGKYPISILKTVPRGLQDVGIHTVDRDVVNALAPDLAISVVVLLLEHIAIARSFGRINEYRINPNQELIAIGVSNMVGHFFQAYPNTGSFSRTALKSKCGVRTPFAGVWTGICVLISIYALTEAFYYISKAALAAIIIHAVVDLIASYKSTYKFWLISPVECLIFLIDIILCVFVSLEAGIYFSVAASIVFLLLRQTFPWGQFLGKVEFRTVSSPQFDSRQPASETSEDASSVHVGTSESFDTEDTEDSSIRHGIVETQSRESVVENEQPGNAIPAILEVINENQDNHMSEHEHHHHLHFHHHHHPSEVEVMEDHDAKHETKNEVSEKSEINEKAEKWPSHSHETAARIVTPTIGPVRTKWWPLTHDNINSQVSIVPPPPGIYVYRFREALTYQNAAFQTERVADYIRKHTRRNMSMEHMSNMKLGDRPWNDGMPRKLNIDAETVDNRPVLRAIVFDMSCTPHVDLTGANALYDLHQELIKYACQPVEIHFAGILSEWAQRALVHAGFGGDVKEKENTSIPYSVRVADVSEYTAVTNDDTKAEDEELQNSHPYEAITDTSRVYFHFDIPDLE